MIGMQNGETSQMLDVTAMKERATRKVWMVLEELNEEYNAEFDFPRIECVIRAHAAQIQIQSVTATIILPALALKVLNAIADGCVSATSSYVR